MITRIESGKRTSQAVVANGFVFLAGQVANRPSREVEDQTRQVLEQIDDLLAKAGSKKKIVSATVYPTGIEDFTTMNRMGRMGASRGQAGARYGRSATRHAHTESRNPGRGGPLMCSIN